MLICHEPWGYRNDGSYALQAKAKKAVNTYRLKDKPWKSDRPFIWQGSPEGLVRTMLLIEKVTKRNKAKAIFFVPPAMEIDRVSKDSQALDAILKKVSGQLTVIDHRRVPRKSTDFIDYMHPNDNYYRRLMKKIRKMQIAIIDN